MQGWVFKQTSRLERWLLILAGLAPIMWSEGTGSEIMQRIAAPMIGGMVTSTVLTLVVIPVLYYALRWKKIAAGVCDAPDDAAAAS